MKRPKQNRKPPAPFHNMTILEARGRILGELPVAWPMGWYQTMTQQQRPVDRSSEE